MSGHRSSLIVGAVKYMTTPRPVKKRSLLVGVIASPDDLRLAGKLKEPPDLFELRLDCLYKIIDRLERTMSTRHAVASRRRIFKAPIIITARDPREGGAGNLSFEKRRDLLDRFLDHAKYLDVELRSARAFKSLLDRARQKKVGVILSYHDFESTPSARSLRAKALLAKDHGADIFKVATRTDQPAHLARLVDFITHPDVDSSRRSPAKADVKISAMGIGKLGGISRLLLARCGSVLNYGSLQQANVEGQLPIDVLRSSLRH
jgi:3-dehydroquinate dehydratase I